MRYIESPTNDAFLNMALEEYVFESLPKSEEYFMLWQNKNAIVVGKYQNAVEEINADYVRENDITVVRRLSGGGAMYQDMGNLNFTFVVDQNNDKTLDFSIFIQPVVRALAQMGVAARQSSRNDIVIDGKKFSGNAQYNKKGRTMHHGTLLFNSRLDTVGKALNP
ncbi:lipoate--protein ligase family protein, partial [Clostridia bacterium OttesenSCG-928-O13]|nr:lipoate--protein ligase family protein [Clostridia bacterium OttesenSCG-928-O13]